MFRCVRPGRAFQNETTQTAELTLGVAGGAHAGGESLLLVGLGLSHFKMALEARLELFHLAIVGDTIITMHGLVLLTEHIMTAGGGALLEIVLAVHLMMTFGALPILMDAWSNTTGFLVSAILMGSEGTAG